MTVAHRIFKLDIVRVGASGTDRFDQPPRQHDYYRGDDTYDARDHAGHLLSSQPQPTTRHTRTYGRYGTFTRNAQTGPQDNRRQSRTLRPTLD